MDKFNTRMNCHKQFENLLIKVAEDIIRCGVNQKQSYEITCKFAEFGKSLIHVFAPVLEDNISLVPTIMDESIKKMLSYQGFFMNKMLKMNEEFQSKEIIIGYNNKPIEKDGVSTIKNEMLFIQKFSIENILKALFSEATTLNEIIKYKKELEKKEAIENLVQTEFWKQKYKDSDTELYFYIMDYYDGYQPFNQIGKHSVAYAIDAVYFSIGPLPLNMSSKLSSIFTSMLSFSGDRKTFGNESIFRHHVNELKHLATEGLHLELPGCEYKKLYFVPHVMRGDNKSIKEAQGYVESFNTRFPCVTCKVDLPTLTSQVEADHTLKRTKQSILQDIQQNSPSTTGIKEMSLWSECPNFCPADNAACDIMHDMAEGVIHYDMAQVLFTFIYNKKFFTLKVLNYRIQQFDFGMDVKNKPEIISKENLKKNKLPLTAAETMYVLEAIPFMIGDLIPKEDEHWELIIYLREICRILFADSYQKGDVSYLKHFITKHHR